MESINKWAEEKSGAIWECTDRAENKLGGGWIYTFRAKKEFDDVTSNRKEAWEHWHHKLDEIFPAAELLPSHMQFLEKHWEVKRVDEWKKNLSCLDGQRSVQLQKVAPQLRALGYSCKVKNERFYLKLPDREALLANWKQLQQKCESLSALDVASSEGVAGDLEFVKANLDHDVVLSRGKEFVHDHMFHVLSKLNLMLTSKRLIKLGQEKSLNPDYVEEKKRVVELVSEYYQRIIDWKLLVSGNGEKVSEKLLSRIEQHIPLLEVTLGSMSDIIASKYEYHRYFGGIDAVDMGFISNYIFCWEIGVWKPYLRKQIIAMEPKASLRFLWRLWNIKPQNWKELL